MTNYVAFSRQRALERMEENLAAMIGSAGKRGSEVLLLGIQLPPNSGRRYTSAFERGAAAWPNASPFRLCLP